ncbi:hypothetical protein [Afifella aestuarii]|uniref:DUF4864 domain-containing protein n=1 Tax=Afifella aestuarii TaxID=1909496 RepID=UPI000FE438C1|nr:hypothetical protein [Afifella aestuarii]
MVSLKAGWGRNLAVVATGIMATVLIGTVQVNSLNAPLPKALPQAAPKADRLDLVAYHPEPRSLTKGQEDAVRGAVETFVWGLSNKQPKAVWRFATEYEQDRFGTEEAAYTFFSKIHPPLVYAKRLTVDSVTQDGEATMVKTYVRDRIGLQWSADFALLQDDAGDWKIVDCQLRPAPGELI